MRSADCGGRERMRGAKGKRGSERKAGWNHGIARSRQYDGPTLKCRTKKCPRFVLFSCRRSSSFTWHILYYLLNAKNTILIAYLYT